RRSTKECGGLQDKIQAPKQRIAPKTKMFWIIGLASLSRAVRAPAHADEEWRVGMRLGGGGHVLQRTRRIEVVGIQPSHQLSAGQLQALIDGVSLALVRLTDQMRDRSAKGLGDRKRCVRRPAVDKDNFKRRAFLADDALKAVGNEFALIKA